MNRIEQNILQEVAGIEGAPQGAYNFRINGQGAGRASSANIVITSKPEGTGIDIHIAPGTKGETVYIPVVISESGVTEVVYNDFYVGADSDVLIVAGCGIHNDGHGLSQHDGIHAFHLEENARVKYVEKHYGEGSGSGQRVLNPITKVYQKTGSYMEMQTSQIKGVNNTKRETYAELGDESTLVIKENLMTEGEDYALTEYGIDLNGKGSSTHVVSRSVAAGQSKQVFLARINGNDECMGHSECDAIIMDSASVQAIPEITANSVDAMLIHEAAIGKIVGEQITKLMTLGLNREEAEEQIIHGFLR